MLAALPKPDVKLDAPFQRLTYTHRSWQDAEMYYFFNESDKEESRMATIAGRGQAQVWDLGTGEIRPIAGATAAGDSVSVPLLFGPYEAKVIVVGPVPAGVSAAAPAVTAGAPLVELTGDWTVDLKGQQLTTPLKSWEDLGTPSFAGPAVYRKQFDAPAAPAGKRVFLEIADVHDYARVKLNGKELEGARLAAVPLGRHRRVESRLQRSGDRGERDHLGPRTLRPRRPGRGTRQPPGAAGAPAGSRREGRGGAAGAAEQAPAAAARWAGGDAEVPHRFPGCWARCGW